MGRGSIRKYMTHKLMGMRESKIEVGERELERGEREKYLIIDG